MKVPLAPIENDFLGKDIVSFSQFDRSSIEKVFDVTKKVKHELTKEEFTTQLKNTLTALIFFEPSSRTFLSFCTAAKRQGGQTLEVQNAGVSSSAVKGESLEDMGRVIQNYADCIVVRHSEVGSVAKVAKAVQIPVINAGDGSGEHPTQAFMDMFTLKERFGSLDGIKGLMAGDLLHGRTVHSLLQGLSHFENVTIYLLAPKKLKLGTELVRKLQSSKMTIVEIDNEKSIPKDCDFWYWTRVQKERFSDPKEYEQIKNTFIVTPQLIKEKAQEDMVIMHPLPRVGEIDTRVDSDPRAIYLTDQIANGVYTRMALLRLVLGR